MPRDVTGPHPYSSAPSSAATARSRPVRSWPSTCNHNFEDFRVWTLGGKGGIGFREGRGFISVWGVHLQRGAQVIGHQRLVRFCQAQLPRQPIVRATNPLLGLLTSA